MKVWLKLFNVLTCIALFKKFFPGDYVRRFLESEVRSDGRNFTDIRKTEIFTSVNKTSFGSSIVKIGPTIVMCFVEGTLAKKSLENVKYSTKGKEKEEYIDVEVSVDKNEEYETSRREKAIKESYLAIWLLNIVKKIFPNLKESLTIPNTFFYWSEKLVANVKVMSFQGNLQDAAFHSIMAALTTAQIPQLDPHSIKEKQMEYEVTGKTRLPITEKDFYLPFTFKIIDSKYIVLDPNHEEEEMSDASFTIILRAETNEFLLFKHNAQLIHPGTLKENLGLCKDLAKKMFPKLVNLAKDGVNSCNIN